jgi:hypothetical protein
MPDFLHDYEREAIMALLLRAMMRHWLRTGEQYPLTRSNCIHDNGDISDTSRIEPWVFARWRRRADGGFRIKLL